jgi:hypothetical protein
MPMVKFLPKDKLPQTISLLAVIIGAAFFYYINQNILKLEKDHLPLLLKVL